MKLVARADHPLQAAIWADTLRAAGIRCEVRNTTLSGAMGEIPFLECAPQVWVLHEGDEPRAVELLRQLREPMRGAPWRCAECGEECEPSFGSCWKCGATRPAE
jgi:hypothetical protein